MELEKYMLLINGQDKTDSVASFRFQDGMCEVVYSSSPKPYHYRAEKVQLLKVQSQIDPSQFIITVDGNPFSQVDEILDFGPFYRFIWTGKKVLTYSKSQVELQKNCLTNQKQAGVFEYFKETASAVSLVAESGLNILSAQYERIKSVSDATVFETFGTHIICHPDDTRPNWIIFVAEVELSGGFDRWVLRQTDKLEVLAPPSVRNRIYQLLQNIIASYRE